MEMRRFLVIFDGKGGYGYVAGRDRRTGMRRLLALLGALAWLLVLPSLAQAQNTVAAVAQPDCSTPGSSPVAGTPYNMGMNLLKQLCVFAVNPSGVGNNVNIAGINGAAPSITNPIYIANAEAADTTGTFTNATQTNSVSNTTADGYATGLISIHGTYGTASANFFVSDDGGVTNYPVICTRSDGTASETGYSGLTNVSRQWSCPVGGNDTLTVTSTAVASGTVSVRVGVSTPTTNSGVVSGTVIAAGTDTTGTLQNLPVTTVNSTPSNRYLQVGLNNSSTISPLTSVIGSNPNGNSTLAIHIVPTTNANVSPTATQCTVACASLIVSGVHNVYGAGFSATVTGWLLLEDATSCAANGTITPLRAYAYPTAGVTQTLSWGDVPRSVATGMALCFSTTGPYTATASTTAFIWADYK